MVAYAINEGQQVATIAENTNIDGTSTSVNTNGSTDNVGAGDERKNEKMDALEPHYEMHEEKVVTIVKNVPVPIQITKHVPYPVEKLVPVPIKVGIIQPYPVFKHVPYPGKY